RAADESTRTPVFLMSALYLDITPVPTVFGGGARYTRAPRLSDSPGTSLTVAETYPTLNYIGNINNGGAYRHAFRTGDEAGNVLRVDGSARWYSASGGAAVWHWYLRENGTGSANPKEAVIQPLP